MNKLMKLGVLLSTATWLGGCSMNSFTVGSDNMDGLALAVACKTDEAIESLAVAQKSDVAGYRRISYALTMAIQEEAGRDVAKQSTYQQFSADAVIEDKDEKQFLYEVSCFNDYLKELRLDEHGTEQCSEMPQ